MVGIDTPRYIKPKGQGTGLIEPDQDAHLSRDRDYFRRGCRCRRRRNPATLRGVCLIFNVFSFEYFYLIGHGDKISVRFVE